MSYRLPVWALLLVAFAVIAGETPLRVEDAWLREAPPVAEVMAGYALLCNDSDEAIRVTGGSSVDFTRVELHTTVESGDAVSMQRLDDLIIVARDCVALAPGGAHLMLFAPKRSLRAGAESTVTLQLSDGRTQDIVFPVRRAGDMTGHHHGH